MALSPIAFIAPNYRDFKNHWLKAYEPGTPTPKSMALDSAGLVTVAKLQLNADGFLESAGGALVIPYIDDSYDLWLFPTEAEADNNDTANAEQLADDITGVSQASLDLNLINDLSQAYEFATVAAMKASAVVFPLGKTLQTKGYYVAGEAGAGNYIVKAPQSFDGFGDHELDNGNIAVLRISNKITVAHFGAQPKPSVATTPIQAAMDALGYVRFERELTYLNGKLTPKDNQTLNLNGSTLERDIASNPGNANSYNIDSFTFFIENLTLKGFTVKNGSINDKHSENQGTFQSFFGVNINGKIERCVFHRLNFLDSRMGITTSNLSNSEVSSQTCEISECQFKSVNRAVDGVPFSDATVSSYALAAMYRTVNLTFERNSALYSTHLIILDTGEGDTKTNENCTIRGNSAGRTEDSSIYCYGHNHLITDNYISQPGKDGIKTNTRNSIISTGTLISNNDVVGSIGWHKSDASGSILLAGDNQTAIDNRVIIEEDDSAFGDTAYMINTVGSYHLISGNQLKTTKFQQGVFLAFNASIYPKLRGVGTIVTDNHIESLNTLIGVWGTEVYEFQIKDNYLKVGGSGGIICTRTVPFSDMRDPLNSIISGNTFDCHNLNAKCIIQGSAGRVILSNNIFKGTRQRDVENASGFIGYGNMSDDATTFALRTCVPRGSQHTSIPARGTWNVGQIVSNGLTGFLCTASGTANTLPALTATTTAASRTITVSDGGLLRISNWIDIAGEAGPFVISNIDGDDIILNKALANTAAGVAVTYHNPTFSTANVAYA